MLKKVNLIIIVVRLSRIVFYMKIPAHVKNVNLNIFIHRILIYVVIHQSFKTVYPIIKIVFIAKTVLKTIYLLFKNMHVVKNIV